MPDRCDAPLLAAAFLYAAGQEWLPEELVGSLPADEPNANDKLRARVAFLHLCHATNVPIAEGIAVLEAVPDRWLGYSAVQQLVRRLELSIGNGELLSEEQRARFLRVCARAEEIKR